MRLPDDIADYVLRSCPARTEEAVMSRFGISYNTLRKIERGEPIRASVAQRLLERIADERVA
ncbi:MULTISPECIES: hypothetical protein [Blastomonas]|jgi:hypothetical protein|uniref:Transcriptional regulator n=1 Tax=Blastomonas fulva TaxID=1550728 RepID=A0ABM6M3A1_9SPHN|nr:MULTISPECIES: hypothetical protein [Blastomonas]AOG01866.1 hypothetical protein BSY18_2020 [Blastomonas sp. RAC04]ASR50331.1 hypothetical protein B5J99_01660 [Blastomonas fulva]KPF76143.1 hypothetical protein IP68_06615 [Blastomonas sp. AAP25]MCO5792464.1 hypothetical protein [Blastomonas sp.]MDK2757061.1 hypothetical protein [Blastomonas fulva]